MTLWQSLIYTQDRLALRKIGGFSHGWSIGATAMSTLIPDPAPNYWRSIWRLLSGRPLHDGLTYWQQGSHHLFVLRRRGWRRSLAERALQIQEEGGIPVIKRVLATWASLTGADG